MKDVEADITYDCTNEILENKRWMCTCTLKPKKDSEYILVTHMCTPCEDEDCLSCNVEDDSKLVTGRG